MNTAHDTRMQEASTHGKLAGIRHTYEHARVRARAAMARADHVAKQQDDSNWDFERGRSMTKKWTKKATKGAYPENKPRGRGRGRGGIGGRAPADFLSVGQDGVNSLSCCLAQGERERGSAEFHGP